MKCRRPFTSFSIQYIYLPNESPYNWTLKTHLLAFERTVGRHTGVNLGQELVDIARHHQLEDLVSLIVPFPY